MPVILVDYENVNGTDGLRGTDALNADDTLVIFYSDNCRKIRSDHIKNIENSGCEFYVIKLKKTGKNALDFYIAAECGALSEKGEKEIVIISNDNGFQAVIDFLYEYKNISDTHIVRAGNIETALTMSNNSDESERRNMIRSRMSKLDLAAECARINEFHRIEGKIKQLVQGTEFEKRSSEIINFIHTENTECKKVLYTRSLHSFGRKDGTEIYHLIKDSVKQ